MKIIIIKTLNFIIKCFSYEGFNNQCFSPTLRLKSLIKQKVLRIYHSNIDWPVDKTSFFKHPEKLIRGDRYPGLSKYCYFDARNGIILGENVWIGPYVALISMNHNINSYNCYQEESPIIIGDNCWIGARATILPGVKLGNHVVVAAGSVVTNSFEENNLIIGGVPAKVIKKIGSYDSKKDKE